MPIEEATMKVKDVGPLAAARKGKGWSQSELADRSGVQQGNISGYEVGTKTLGIAAARWTRHCADLRVTCLTQ